MRRQPFAIRYADRHTLSIEEVRAGGYRLAVGPESGSGPAAPRAKGDTVQRRIEDLVASGQAAIAALPADPAEREREATAGVDTDAQRGEVERISAEIEELARQPTLRIGDPQLLPIAVARGAFDPETPVHRPVVYAFDRDAPDTEIEWAREHGVADLVARGRDEAAALPSAEDARIASLRSAVDVDAQRDAAARIRDDLERLAREPTLKLGDPALLRTAVAQGVFNSMILYEHAIYGGAFLPLPGSVPNLDDFMAGTGVTWGALARSCELQGGGAHLYGEAFYGPDPTAPALTLYDSARIPFLEQACPQGVRSVLLF